MSLAAEVDGFVVRNRIDDRAASTLRSCDPDVQRSVLERGDMTDCSNPSSALMGRIRQAKDLDRPPGAPRSFVGLGIGSSPGGAGPTGSAEIEDFIRDNRLDESAARSLREANPEIQKAVLDRGPLVGTQNPSSATIVRIRDARKELAASPNRPAAAGAAAAVPVAAAVPLSMYAAYSPYAAMYSAYYAAAGMAVPAAYGTMAIPAVAAPTMAAPAAAGATMAAPAASYAPTPTYPQAAAPIQTYPQTAAPTQTYPQAAPTQSYPQTAAPTQTFSQTAAPTQTYPQAAPALTYPQAAPTQSYPQAAAPTSSYPQTGAPTQSYPAPSGYAAPGGYAAQGAPPAPYGQMTAPAASPSGAYGASPAPTYQAAPTAGYGAAPAAPQGSYGGYQPQGGASMNYGGGGYSAGPGHERSAPY